MSEFDLRKTVFLPQTTFSMQRGDDAAIIPEVTGYGFAKKGQANPPFKTIIDGPPYANGNIHMGHALNKILKDITARSFNSLGYDVFWAPGWDCHGLPIETHVEKALIEENPNFRKSDLSVGVFRERCRKYAFEQVFKQRDQFKSLGINANWNEAWTTTGSSATNTVYEFLNLVQQGRVYPSRAPVWWSTIEETALAEAEIEYQELKVTSAYIGYKLRSVISAADAHAAIDNAHFLIWTTTPWTIPASGAIAFNPDIHYGMYTVLEGNEALVEGFKFVMAHDLVHAFAKEQGIQFRFEGSLNSDFYGDIRLEHPLCDDTGAYSRDIYFIPSKHVTADTGTGLVHIAPDHGGDDFKCWNAADLGDYPIAVDTTGAYLPDVPLFAGMNVLQKTPKGQYIFEFTNAKVLEALMANGTLFGSSKVTISYPHSWRSHAPLINKVTKQWYLSNTITEDDLNKSIDGTDFIPASAENRFRETMLSRPDWLISRQRKWGTPITLVVDKDGEIVTHPVVIEAIKNFVNTHKAAGWIEHDKRFILTRLREFIKKQSATDFILDDSYDVVQDVLDVWFDSAMVGKAIAPLSYRKHETIRIEGSDQHRGWFGSTMAARVSSENSLPISTIVLTHGFVLDDKGEKMSKSKGNVICPLEKSEQFGVDTLRLWVAMSDFTKDTRVGDKILQGAHDVYKRFRLTLRYLDGALKDFDGKMVNEEDFPCLEAYIANTLRQVQIKVEDAYDDFRFSDAVAALNNFCTNDLSAFLFDIRKDVLYCDRPDSLKRRAYLTLLWNIRTSLLSWLNPITPLMVGEACKAAGIEYYDVIPFYNNGIQLDNGLPTPPLAEWETIRNIISRANSEIERVRREGKIKSSFDAKLVMFLTMAEQDALNFLGEDAAPVLRVSQIEVYDGNGNITVEQADGQRCERSRRFFTDVGSDPRYPTLSARDADAVEYWKAHAVL